MVPTQVSKTHLHLPLGIGLGFAAINRTAIKVWKDPRRTIFRKNGLLEKTTNSLIKSCEFSNQCSRITCFRTPFIHWLRSFAATSYSFQRTSSRSLVSSRLSVYHLTLPLEEVLRDSPKDCWDHRSTCYLSILVAIQLPKRVGPRNLFSSRQLKIYLYLSFPQKGQMCFHV